MGLEYVQSFEEQLKIGQLGESLIAKWLIKKEWSVLPVYEKELDTGKGPRLFTPGGEIIAADMLIYKANDAIWIEAKHKDAFTWHRITKRWVTGIDLKHYLDYCKVDEISPWPVWLLFLQRGGQAKDSPPDSPSGLFGNTLKHLQAHENHRFEDFGHGGMVYWAHGALRKLAELEDIK